MILEKLIKLKGIERKNKRLGRGFGSGKGGHTIGRGTKGQKSRKSSNVKLGFEGGQVPLYKRLPRIDGFRNPNTKEVIIICLNDLEVFDDGKKITPGSLVEKRMVKSISKGGVKILSKGKLSKKLKLSGFKYSKKAQEKLEKSGSVIVG
jgi:large subunit ribosomal protein L15